MKKLNPAEKFVRYALGIGALELIPEGRRLKNGRISPYFFNSGLFRSGRALTVLTEAYGGIVSGFAMTGKGFGLLYGPPYKGTILAPAVAMTVASVAGINPLFCSSRKEAKSHGDAGVLIGSPIMSGDRVLIIDDVITDGGTKREAVELVKSFSGIPVGLAIAFDRQERGATSELSAVQEFERDYGIPVRSIATIADLISVLQKIPAESGDDNTGEMLEKILGYQKQYGV